MLSSVPHEKVLIFVRVRNYYLDFEITRNKVFLHFGSAEVFILRMPPLDKDVTKLSYRQVVFSSLSTDKRGRKKVSNQSKFLSKAAKKGNVFMHAR